MPNISGIGICERCQVLGAAGLASPLGWHHLCFAPWQDTCAQRHGMPHALLRSSPACPCFSWASFGPKSQLICNELIQEIFSPFAHRCGMPRWEEMGTEPLCHH